MSGLAIAWCKIVAFKDVTEIILMSIFFSHTREIDSADPSITERMTWNTSISACSAIFYYFN